jgi:hypothetical protein
VYIEGQVNISTHHSVHGKRSDRVRAVQEDLLAPRTPNAEEKVQVERSGPFVTNTCNQVKHVADEQPRQHFVAPK